MATDKTSYLPSKPRYEILDALRGVAALMIVAFHMLEYYSKGPAYQILNHGYLAVDFFFILSGFVIGYAYDDRWDRMNLGNFFKRRLVRLHPMLIFGTIVGAILYYHQDYVYGVNFDNASTPWWALLLTCLYGFTLLPIPNKWNIRGMGEMHPLNNVFWTLMWEYIANILYATVIRRFSRIVLTLFVIFSAFLTVNLCMNIDVFGVWAERTSEAYTVIGGWTLEPHMLVIAVTRLLYPFFCGLLLSRLFTGFDGGKKLLNVEKFRVKGGFWKCVAAVAILLAMPRIGGTDPANFWMNGLYETVVILICFPLIVLFGVGSKAEGATGKICKFLGDISYPLYVTHLPFVFVMMNWAATHAEAPTATHFTVAAGLYIMAVGVAYAALKLYDLPVREFLKDRLFKKKAA
ncbi:MAG: acyltransferase [Bacteroidales bacterium]|nr:acyltransferase [Bacteroidales bacterium]